ncbi:MAG TPA: hypothetical protein VIM10_02780 [Actinopolymorphaceae bacterium]
MGNAESAAGIEVTLGGLVLTTSEPVLLALTGAPAHPAEPLGAAMNQSFTLLPGERLLLGTPRTRAADLPGRAWWPRRAAGARQPRDRRPRPPRPGSPRGGCRTARRAGYG